VRAQSDSLGIRAGLASLGAGVALVIALLAGASPGHAAADSVEKRGCNPHRIELGGRTYVFYRQNMSCRRAKRYAHRVYESNGNWWPDRFKCGSGSNFNSGGSCVKRRGQDELFGWHPGD
jgi:hypothetical protein